MMKSRLSIAIATIVYSAPSFNSAFADPAGRITAPPTREEGRCTNTIPTPEQCAERRQMALEIGCVTQEEHDALVRYNAYPQCSVFNPPETMLEGWCPCGCVHPDTLMSVVKMDSGDQGVESADKVAKNVAQYKLVTLSPDADFDAVDFPLSAHGIDLSTSGPAMRDLIVITTLDGRVLKLTQTHPVVLANGEIKQAKDLRPDDLALSIEGEALDIVSVERVPYKGEVYNFASSADLFDVPGHIVFGQGLAIGDLTLEALLNQYKKSVELRK